jgi:hypothetical protein
MDQTEAAKKVHEILDENFWLPGLEADEFYFRTQDDCDGDKSEGMSVMIDRQGDAWVTVRSRPMHGCRFRMPLVGGGRSPRVRNALVILAEAIRLDNESDPTL